MPKSNNNVEFEKEDLDPQKFDFCQELEIGSQIESDMPEAGNSCFWREITLPETNIAPKNCDFQ